jgi:hypothetical protein
MFFCISASIEFALPFFVQSQKGRKKMTETIIINPDLFYTDNEVAKVLSLNVQTLRNWRWKNQGPAFVKMGQARRSIVRYKGKDLLDYMEKNRVTPGE